MGIRMFVGAVAVLSLVGLCTVVGSSRSVYAAESGVLVLEDFQSADQDGFPVD